MFENLTCSHLVKMFCVCNPIKKHYDGDKIRYASWAECIGHMEVM